jgi:hypothetical protein
MPRISKLLRRASFVLKPSSLVVRCIEAFGYTGRKKDSLGFKRKQILPELVTNRQLAPNYLSERS